MESRRKSSIIIALDNMNPDQAMDSVRTLKDYVWGFKVNDLLYTQEGMNIIM